VTSPAIGAATSVESLRLPIESVHTTLVDVPLIRPHRFSVQTMTHQSMVIVRLRTRDGIEGIGEAVVPGGPWWGGESIEGIKALIDNYIAPLLTGRDASRVGAVAALLDRTIAGAQFAKAAVEMAVWDARGKALAVPVFELLGGLYREEIPVTWAVGADPADLVIREIEDKLATGSHRSFKLKMGAGEPADDVTRIGRIALALAGATSLRVDLNGAWDEQTATRWLPALAEAGIELIEQPLPAWNVDGLARLSRRLEVPLMADESIRTPNDASRVARDHAAAVLSVKIAKCGGLLPVQRIAAIAQGAGISCHGGTTIESSIGTAASAHLFCATPGVSAGSELFGPLLLDGDLTQEPVHYEDGCIAPPTGPGLGVTLDEELVRRYARSQKTVSAGRADAKRPRTANPDSKEGTMTTTTTITTNTERMQKLDNAWNARDWDTFDAYHDGESVVVHWPGQDDPTRGGSDHRVESIRFCNAFPDNRVHNQPYAALFGEGDYTSFVTRFTGTFTGPLELPDGTTIQPTGKAFDVLFSTNARWADGKIVEEWLFYDSGTFLKQIGLA
jgi:muconate cycloisomerase